MAPITNEQAKRAYAPVLRNERNTAARFYGLTKGTELAEKYLKDARMFGQMYVDIMTAIA